MMRSNSGATVSPSIVEPPSISPRETSPKRTIVPVRVVWATAGLHLRVSAFAALIRPNVTRCWGTGAWLRLETSASRPTACSKFATTPASVRSGGRVTVGPVKSTSGERRSRGRVRGGMMTRSPSISIATSPRVAPRRRTTDGCPGWSISPVKVIPPGSVQMLVVPPPTRPMTRFGLAGSVLTSMVPRLVMSTARHSRCPLAAPSPKRNPDASGCMEAALRSEIMGSGSLREPRVAFAGSVRMAVTCRVVMRPVRRRSLRNTSRSCAGGAGCSRNVAIPEMREAASALVRVTGSPSGVRSILPRTVLGFFPFGGARPAGTKEVGSTASVPAASLATKREPTSDASTFARRALFRTNRFVGARRRRMAGSTVASGKLVGAIAALTVTSAMGVRSARGSASASTPSGESCSNVLAWNDVDASIDNLDLDSSALALITAPTCSQQADIRSSCSRRTTSAPRPAATRARGSRLTSPNQPPASSATLKRFAGQAP